MRLHLGSGDRYWPGFQNVDKFNTSADILCDVTKLSVEDNSAEEIHAIHLLEHLHRMTVEPTLFEWFRALKPGGRLIMEMPCLDKIIELLVKKEKNIRLTLLGLYGDPRDQRPGMEHKWGWCYEELEDQLKQVGFTQITFETPKFHIAERDMRCIAVKPHSTT